VPFCRILAGDSSPTANAERQLTAIARGRHKRTAARGFVRIAAMSATARAYGVARSLAMYYGIPWRPRQLRRFYSRFVERGALCFDIGAHAGNRVRCWRQLGARVVAVEPQADFVRLLEWLFGRDADVEIVAKAVGKAAGAAELMVSERTPTVTTLSRTWVTEVQRDPKFAHVRWARGERVDVVTLQSLVERHGEPQFVKIDVEGFEADVLEGLATPVQALSFEYLAATRAIALQCIDRLVELGRYEYNWSRGESLRFESERWLGPPRMRALLEALAPDAGSGDVYAVRRA
jgi:FkbM family methyltransferase